MAVAALSRNEAILQVLTHTPLFADFADRELSRLAFVARPRSYDEGEIIFHREDPGTGVFIVQSGTVKISIEAPDGQEMLMALLCAGELFGEAAVLDGGGREVTATAMEPSETIYLPREHFLGFLDEHPAAMRQVILLLTRRLRREGEQRADLVFHDVYGRLAKKLLELTRSHGRRASNGAIDIRLGLTQQDLANLVGASRESVNKAMKQLRDAGIVGVTGQRITVLDAKELSEKAELD